MTGAAKDGRPARQRLALPLTEDAARALRVGDEVLVSGRIITAREAAHRHLVEQDDQRAREQARGSFVYHCGPVVARDPETRGWRFVAAGPSTSIREEPYQGEVIARYGLRGVIGEGGMGPATRAALQEHGAVYLQPLGDLALVLAKRVTAVEWVHLLEELGSSEAIWAIRVKDFPAVVTMDSHGESLYASRARRPSPDAPERPGGTLPRA
jgi:fumarate hydratase subunit beta